MYRMFYNHDVTGDTLFIVMNTESLYDHSVITGDVVAMYSGEELVGVNINNLSRVLKIKAHGMIVTPGEELVDVVNTILKRAKLPALEYCTYSGYRVGQVASIKDVSSNQSLKEIAVEMAGETLTAVTQYTNLKAGDYVVLSLDGTIQYDGAVFKTHTEEGIVTNCHICNAKELRLNIDTDGAFVVEGYKTGEDFYLAGE